MTEVPQSTVAKPLTAVDYIACLELCDNAIEVAQYADRVPLVIWHDRRFVDAVVARLKALRESHP